MPAVKQTKAVRESAGRTAASKPLSGELGSVASLSLVSVGLFSLIFPPVEFWPLAFVCLAPWVYAVCTAGRPWVAYWVTFAAGWLFFLINLMWLKPVTGLGFVALALYLAAYWPLTAFAIRTGVRLGLAPVWTLPIVWVACEFTRAWLMSGFPWLFVGHAFYRQLWLIQISDIYGAYGVSFVSLLVNGALATWLCSGRSDSAKPTNMRRQFLTGGIATIVALAGTCAYGVLRMRQTEQLEPGPRVAVVQEDFPLVSTPPFGDPREVSFARYLTLAAAAAATKPDLLAFPETAWNSRQNIEFLQGQSAAPEDTGAIGRTYGKLCHEATAAFARGEYSLVNAIIARFEAWLPKRRLPRLPDENGSPVTVAVGSIAVETFPEATYPKVKVYNSALIYDMDGTQRVRRYDKNHLVPFGEIVPFRYGRLHFLYKYLNQLSPFSDGGKYEYSLTPGSELTVFELRVGERVWRFGTPICYEDVMPYLIRNYVWEGSRRRVDFLVNMSNDGWFQYSAELPQHLAICVFRAVENRVGFARAVNTGISGFVDPNGRIYSTVEQDGRRYGPGLVGFRTDHVKVDSRISLYGRFGDWFASGCLVAATMLWVAGIWSRWLTAFWWRVTRRRVTGAV